MYRNLYIQIEPILKIFLFHSSPLSPTGVIAGALCRRYGCRPVMIVGGLLVTISALCAALSTQLWHLYICYAVAGTQINTLLEAVRHFRSVVLDAGSRGTTAHAHQCCIFQSYAKTVPSRMKLTMREPASMTTDKGGGGVVNDIILQQRITLDCSKKVTIMFLWRIGGGVQQAPPKFG